MEILEEKNYTIKEDSLKESVITISNLSKSFGNHTVLRDVNLVVNKGENVVVLGRSGTGKSVLIQCIVRLLEADYGRIEVFGKNVLSLKKKELDTLRLKIGFLFQSAALYDSMTVRENLEFPLIRNKISLSPGELKNRVEEVLDDVGLIEAIDKMPSELSGGMRKRIGLARTLILKPEIILYDEPSTGLDPVTSREISSLILKIQEKQHVTSIIITHDIPCARLTADRIVVLKDGVFIAEGSFDELQKSEDSFVRSFFEDYTN